MGESIPQEDRNGIISVFNKDGVVDLAKGLDELGFQLYSTGGTGQRISEAGIDVEDISELTGNPEILDDRVKTIGFKTAAGILARDTEADRATLEEYDARWLSAVVFNFYDFDSAAADPNNTEDKIWEMIDIGGPSSIRAAVKGKRLPLVNPDHYAETLDRLRNGTLDEEFRRKLYTEAFYTTASYDTSIATWLGRGAVFGFVGKESDLKLKYGENGYQEAKFYEEKTDYPLAFPTKFEQLLGGEPGRTNLTDSDRLLKTAIKIAATFEKNFDEHPLIAVGGKHGNACGAAVGTDPVEVATNMRMGNELSIFGGIVVLNFEVDEDVAKALVTDSKGETKLLSGIVAPSFTAEALNIITDSRKQTVLVFANPELSDLGVKSLDTRQNVRQLSGGYITQDPSNALYDFADPAIKNWGEMTDKVRRDLLLADAICTTSNSNTMTYVRDGMLIANAVGQQDRVGAVELGQRIGYKAGHGTRSEWLEDEERVIYHLDGAAVASDSFFPFEDGMERLVEAGVVAVLSRYTTNEKRDNRVAQVALDKGAAVTMLPDATHRGFEAH